MDDKELIEKIKAGDLKSFSELISRHQNKVFVFLVVRVNNRHEAEDLTQEAFLTAYKKIKDFQTDQPVLPWLRGIALNLLRNYWRKKKAVASGGHEELQILVDQQIDQNTDSNEEPYLIELMLSCLSETDSNSKELIQLRYKEEKPISELKNIFNLNHSTLTMRLHRIRDELKKCINR
ncbi:MAG: RNA polymerase sigma factor, partial [Lentisphaeraceae bacterium]|nr:RNA polymerase sigma factor [Lentisphaeraceae bacterium]